MLVAAGEAGRRTMTTEDFEQTIALVGRAQGGDGAALDELFARYYERVRRIVGLRLGAALRGRVDSNDVLQEVFLEALKGFDRFEMRNRGAFINWLARMAESRIRDLADWHGAAKRDAGREVPLWSGDDSSGLDRELTATGLAPPDGAAHADQVAQLEAAIARLPPDDRELILLRIYADAEWSEVAQETGRASADAARMAFREALKRLARLMGEG